MTVSKSAQNKLVIIGGPTATGKTALAIKVAREVGGEIVSADARQIYRGMSVGTGKELPENSKFQIPNSKRSLVGKKENGDRQLRVGFYVVGGIKVWLYDVAAPDQLFSAADYRKTAWPVVEDIWRRGKTPLVVGGTGFYIKALLRGFGSEGIPPDWELRKQLDDWTVEQLARRLQKLSPARWGRMNESDRQNPRRLIRAIELERWKVESGKWKVDKEGEGSESITRHPSSVLFLGLTAPYPYLYQRIDQRVEEMMQAGLLQEVESLVKRYGWSVPGLNGIGYRQWRPYFEGKSSLVECVQRIKFDTHACARRQMTWFKREPEVVWFDVSRPGFDEKVLQLVKSFR